MTHVTDRLAAYLAGELDPAASAAVREHLAACGACAAEEARARAAWDLLGSVAVEPRRPVGVWPAVRARTLGREAWFFGSRPWIRRGWAACAVAVGLTLGVLVPWVLVPGEAGADTADPILTGSAWNDETTADLAGWWLATAAEEEGTP